MFKVAITDDNRQYAEMVGAYLQSKESAVFLFYK